MLKDGLVDGRRYFRQSKTSKLVAIKETPEIAARLAGKRYQDLRDTAVTWLARAGATMAEICAVSSHWPSRCRPSSITILG